jgi:dihydroxyacetone synthase
MPNLNYIRPCDFEEVIGAWSIALGSRHNPTMISLGRDPVGLVPNTSRTKMSRGAYVVIGPVDPRLTLVSCGTNLHYVVGAANVLIDEGLPTRVVSAPCLDLFEKQDSSYRHSVFPLDGSPIISVEEYVATTWARYTTASISMTGYGYSASNPSNFERFGLDTAGILRRTKAYLADLDGQNARMAGWRQL